MKLQSLRINKKSIVIGRELVLEVEKKIAKGAEGTKEGMTSTEGRTSTFHEMPLVSFDKAIAKLVKPALTFLEQAPEWAKGMRIIGFNIKETKKGTRSMQILFDKNLELVGASIQMKTPFIRIDKPQEGEQEKPTCDAPSKKIIGNAILEVEKYAAGERSQQLLDFKEPEEEEQDDGQDQLPLESEE